MLHYVFRLPLGTSIRLRHHKQILTLKQRISALFLRSINYASRIEQNTLVFFKLDFLGKQCFDLISLLSAELLNAEDICLHLIE
jgi:hypothetical protein